MEVTPEANTETVEAVAEADAVIASDDVASEETGEAVTEEA